METMELTPNKLKVLCEVDWPALGVGWAPEVSLDKTVVNEVYRVIEKPRLPEKFPYIECWQDAVLSWPTWLRPYQEVACRIMVEGVDAASKCRETAKEPTLAEEPEEVYHCPICHSIHLCHQCPVLYPASDTGWGNSRDSHTCKIWFRSSWGFNSPDLPGSYGLYTHSKSISAHHIFPTQLRASDQSL
jgi:hypothetical protein